MDWYEELIENCPPLDAKTPIGEKYYRISKNEVATNEDFISLRRLKPQRKVNCCECIARSISVLNGLAEAKNHMKLPRNRKLGKNIFEITLNESDGLTKKTYGPGHYSWWRSNSFNFASARKVV